jgi:hypothetical protein
MPNEHMEGILNWLKFWAEQDSTEVKTDSMFMLDLMTVPVVECDDEGRL